jgi:tellurite methyltransferase
MVEMTNPYDERYERPGYYWGKAPSQMCYRVLQLLPPDRPLRLLDIGCGEGRNSVFFARNGYQVTAFDTSPGGVEKTKQLAAEAGVRIDAFVADINAFRLTEPFDVLFSTGVLQYVRQERRQELFANYQEHTGSGGLNVFSVFVRKPFIAEAPDAEKTSHRWLSGELLTWYHDWRIEFCTEEIFDCMSSGVPHEHAVNRMVARKETDPPAGTADACPRA